MRYPSLPQCSKPDLTPKTSFPALAVWSIACSLRARRTSRSESVLTRAMAGGLSKARRAVPAFGLIRAEGAHQRFVMLQCRCRSRARASLRNRHSPGHERHTWQITKLMQVNASLLRVRALSANVKLSTRISLAESLCLVVECSPLPPRAGSLYPTAKTITRSEMKGLPLGSPTRALTGDTAIAGRRGALVCFEKRSAIWAAEL
jgi:hypothetical protein